MTRQEAIELINSGKVNAKVYGLSKRVNNVDVIDEIDAFELDGMYYLVITKYEAAFKFIDHKLVELKNKVHANFGFKEFSNKNQANAYFKKASVGFTRYNA